MAVVGDSAVGLLALLSAKQMGAERVIAISHHANPQKLAREFGATDIEREHRITVEGAEPLDGQPVNVNTSACFSVIFYRQVCPHFPEQLGRTLP